MTVRELAFAKEWER
jgi:hypothetical protein